MLTVMLSLHLVLREAALQGLEGIIGDADAMLSEPLRYMHASYVKRGTDIIASFIRKRFLHGSEDRLQHTGTCLHSEFSCSMNPQVINIERVPFLPVLSKHFVENVHEMNVPVYSHVGHALGASCVLVVVTIELYC